MAFESDLDLEKKNRPEMEQSTKPAESQAAWWQPAITMFLKLSVWIGAPIIIALYLGQWLDQKYHTKPWFFFILIGLAFIISMAGLIWSALAEYKKIEQAGQPDGPERKEKSSRF